MAIDGKTCRGSHDGAKGLGALHIVSAWASEEGIALGQVATEAKSNEITAIPQLLGQIDLAGTRITIDAMGCQKDIVEQIVAGKGDCVIAVKDNQPKLLAAIQTYFFDHLAPPDEKTDRTKGRPSEVLVDSRPPPDEKMGLTDEDINLLAVGGFKYYLNGKAVIGEPLEKFQALVIKEALKPEIIGRSKVARLLLAQHEFTTRLVALSGKKTAMVAKFPDELRLASVQAALSGVLAGVRGDDLPTLATLADIRRTPGTGVIEALGDQTRPAHIKHAVETGLVSGSPC